MPYCSSCEQNATFVKTTNPTVKACGNCGAYNVTKTRKSHKVSEKITNK